MNHNQDKSGTDFETATVSHDSAVADDTFRYIEYLQAMQITEGWQEFFVGENQGLDTATIQAILKVVAPTLAETDHTVLEMAGKMLSETAPSTTRFESPFTEVRYRPILVQVVDAAKDLGLPAIRPIDVVTSTDISCTPTARPTEDRHLLFVGEGTARFCNYWTKALSRVFFTIKRLPDGLSQAEWDKAILAAKPSGIRLAVLFAIRYAFQGTLLRFGWIPNIPEETDWRGALFGSMMLFLVAHEYVHFVAHEDKPETRGVLSAEESQKLELWCDKIAIDICVHVGRKGDSIQLRAGLGALAFFRVLQICYAVRQLCVAAGLVAVDCAGENVESHPALDLRVNALAGRLLESAAPSERDLVATHVNGLLSMIAIMERLVTGIVEQAITQKVKGDPAA